MVHVLVFQLSLLHLSAKLPRRQSAYDVGLYARYCETLLVLGKTLKELPMELRMGPFCVTMKTAVGQLGMIDWPSGGFQASIWFEYL